jgi:streptogramin lyase
LKRGLPPNAKDFGSGLTQEWNLIVGGTLAIKEENTMREKQLAVTIVILSIVLCSLPSFAQKPARGTITGTVTADQGKVIGFRVAAHNLDRRLWYTVFTSKGQYAVPQALPGRYEVLVNEPGYNSPTISLVLASGESKSADLALKKSVQSGPADIGSGGDEGPNLRGGAGKIIYVKSIEELFPPGPALGLLKEDCTGCHANGWSALHYNKEQFLEGIERMTETGPGYNPYVLALGRTVINKSQKEMLADYLVTNFGPAAPRKEIWVEPLVPDESVVSNQIYVSYDIPENLPLAPGGAKIGGDIVDGVVPQMPNEYDVQHLQAAFISPVDGNIWLSSGASNSLLRLNPTAYDSSERWKNYPIKGADFVHPSGLTVDKKGHVWWPELRGGMLGELDPLTGTQIRHPMPQQVGALHETVVDKDGNICFDLIWGAEFGRLEAKTRKIHMYPTPTPDNGLYGMVVDKHGNMWAAGWQKGTINKWDVDTESVKEYKVPNSWGHLRRITVDSKGIVWASEAFVGILARFDPATEKLTEYKIPLNGAVPYEVWADKFDNIWIADQPHSAMIKFQPNTAKFTFYLMPQPHQSVPKIEVAEDNTIWFGTRGKKITTAVHFYPDGYTAAAPPIP